MLLRRFVEHVKSQNWTAVGLDFLIVVSGVFIGIQVANWNEARLARQELDDAISRLILETELNLSSIAQLEEETTASLKTMGEAIDILQTCNTADGNHEIVEQGLGIAQATRGMILRMGALEELNNAPYLLRQQSEAQRKKLSDALFALNLFISESHWSENFPLEERIENNTNISVSPMRHRELTYHGYDFSSEARALTLAVPIGVACKDESLIKSLYIWERWQSFIPRNIHIVRAELESILDVFKP